MNPSNIITAKHGFIIGNEGSGKTTLAKKLIIEKTQKCIYLSMYNDDYGDLPTITINDRSPETKDAELAKIESYIQNNESFVIRVPSGYVGHMNCLQYRAEVITEIIRVNTDFTLIIDDAVSLAHEYRDVFMKLLQQKQFTVISIFHSISTETEYIFDYAVLWYIFKLSPTNFEFFEKRELLSSGDLTILNQQVGEYIVIS